MSIIQIKEMMELSFYIIPIENITTLLLDIGDPQKCATKL